MIKRIFFFIITIVIPKYASTKRFNLLNNSKKYFANNISGSLMKAGILAMVLKIIVCNMYKFIKIPCSLPVSLASAEGSF